MMSGRIILSILLGFPLGIASQFLFEESFTVTFVFLVLSFVSALLYRRTHSLIFFFAPIIFLSASLGILRTEIAQESRDNARSLVEESDTYLLEVVSDPVRTEFNQKFEGRISGSEKSKILVRAPYYPRVSYGDVVSVSGTIREPEDFETESGRLFPYTTFLEKDYIFYTLYPNDIEVVLQDKGNPLIRSLLSLKHALTEQLDQIVGKPSSSLLSGVTLGVEDGLGETLEEQFRRTGVIHILVLSGYNVTLVADGVSKTALTFLPRTFALSLGIIGIVLFALMSGATATIIRASIMASIAVIGRLFYRAYDAGHALLVAAGVMLFHNPYILLYDPSFQLSFLATLGIIYIAPRFEKRLLFISYRQLKEIIAATLGTQLIVLPLLVFMNGEISLVSLITNILIVPIVPVLMFLGISTSLVSFVSETTALPIAWVSTTLSSYVFKVVEFFSNIPFATIHVPTLSSVLLVGIYTIAIMWFIKTKTA